MVFFEKAISQGANEGGVFNKDGPPKLGKDGKPLKVKVGLKAKLSNAAAANSSYLQLRGLMLN
jgi:hypothetical protein